MVCTNSFCFNLNKMDVFPDPSRPSVTILISILGPMCTLLSLVKVMGMAGSSGSRSGLTSENCFCCASTEASRALISGAASRTRASSCRTTRSHWTQTSAT